MLGSWGGNVVLGKVLMVPDTELGDVGSGKVESEDVVVP